MRSSEKEHLNYYFSIVVFSVDVWPLTFLLIVFFACGDAVVGEDSSSLGFSPFSVNCWCRRSWFSRLGCITLRAFWLEGGLFLSRSSLGVRNYY